MAFFLMAVMAVVFIGISAITAFLSFYKQGKVVEKKWVFITLTVLLLGELAVSFTGLPSNYIVKKAIDVVLMGVLVGNVFLYKKAFDKSRIVLSIMSIVSLVVVLFL